MGSPYDRRQAVSIFPAVTSFMPGKAKASATGPVRAPMPEKSSTRDQFGWWFRWCHSDDPVLYWKKRQEKRR